MKQISTSKVWKSITELTSIPKFEKNNDVSINAYALELNDNDGNETEGRRKRNIIPIFITKNHMKHHVNLFLHSGHFYFIKNFNRFLSSKFNWRQRFCRNCLHGFRSNENLLQHEMFCNKA